VQGVRDELCVPVWHSDAGGRDHILKKSNKRIEQIRIIDNLIIPNHVRCGACFGFVIWHFHVQIYFSNGMTAAIDERPDVFFCAFCAYVFHKYSISFRNSIFRWHPSASIILYLNILCKWPWNHSKFTPGGAFTADSGIRTLSTVVCHDMFSHNKKETCWNQTLKTLNLSVDTRKRKKNNRNSQTTSGSQVLLMHMLQHIASETWSQPWIWVQASDHLVLNDRN